MQFGQFPLPVPEENSPMYGAGYDFAPQFAYCLKDVVGSLPVGHEIGIRTFNTEAGFTSRQTDLDDDNTEKMKLELKITNKMMPYVVVISTDNDPGLQKEIVGSFISPSF
jgi:hypothetical protein